MAFTADYLANCRRFGIAPSSEDFAEYLAEAESGAPEDDWEDEG